MDAQICRRDWNKWSPKWDRAISIRPNRIIYIDPYRTGWCTIWHADCACARVCSFRSTSCFCFVRSELNDVWLAVWQQYGHQSQIDGTGREAAVWLLRSIATREDYNMSNWWVVMRTSGILDILCIDTRWWVSFVNRPFWRHVRGA